MRHISYAVSLIFSSILANTAWCQPAKPLMNSAKPVVNVAKPVVNAVANVASYAAGSVCPGEMVVIFGTGLGPAQVVGLQLDSQARVATTLSQVSVLFDGIPAPLIYVSAGQVSAMAPFGLAAAFTQVQVSYQGVAS